MDTFASALASRSAQTVDPTAGDIVRPLPTLLHTISCNQAFEWLTARPDQPAAALVDEAGRVVGLINRLRFLAEYSRRYVPELHGKHPIERLANTKPLIVESSLPLAELGAMLAFERPEALTECFVVTRDKRYLGIGTGETVMRAKVGLLLAREERLKIALESATAASEAKSNFLALMSHELRTPLNAIIGFSEILKGELFGPLGSTRYREYAGDIHGAGRHLLALINDILDLSKAEAGKMELTPGAIHIGMLADACIKLVRDKGRENGLRVSARVPEAMPMLHADELRVRQILLNLLSNAIKFTPVGGSVELSADMTYEGGIVFRVTDTGIGMAPEAIPIALEPFRQIASPMARKAEGTGLGLSLVKSLVEQHEGELAIRSAVDQGTTVEVRFPPWRSLHAKDKGQVRLAVG